MLWSFSLDQASAGLAFALTGVLGTQDAKLFGAIFGYDFALHVHYTGQFCKCACKVTKCMHFSLL